VSDTTTDPPGVLAAEFEGVYRANVVTVTSYFARRSADPQTVGDLTSDTFVRAITSFGTFDPTRGSPRSWLFGIARRVFAAHCEAVNRGKDATRRLAGHRVLDVDETAELVARIDAERAGRDLVAGLAALSPLDREVVELVDVAGLTPKEAAAVLGVSPGALRIRLFRTRGKLRGLVGSENDG
jgi:RNA polymerase sigma factor (sigma-70 family)